MPEPESSAAARAKRYHLWRVVAAASRLLAALDAAAGPGTEAVFAARNALASELAVIMEARVTDWEGWDPDAHIAALDAEIERRAARADALAAALRGLHAEITRALDDGEDAAMPTPEPRACSLYVTDGPWWLPATSDSRAGLPRRGADLPNRLSLPLGWLPNAVTALVNHWVG